LDSDSNFSDSDLYLDLYLDSDPKDLDPKDSDPKDSDPKDSDPKDSDPKDLDPKDSDFAHETKVKVIHELLVNDWSQEKFVFHPECNSLLTDSLRVWQS